MKKLLKYTVIVVLSLILVVVIGGYVVLNQVDFNKYTKIITKVVAEKTGRELAIEDIKVKPSLMPTIELKNVAFYNAKWAKSPVMVSAEAIDISFAIIPLLSKNIVINRFSVINAEVNLEESKDGGNNWTFEAVEPEKVAEHKVSFNWSLIKSAEASEIDVKNDDLSEMLSSFAIRQVVFENVKVSYIDKKAKEQIYNIKNLNLNENSDDDIDFSFDVNNGYYQGKGSFGSLKKIASGKKFPVNASLDVMGIKVDTNLVLSDALNNLNFSGDVKSFGFMGKDSIYNEKIDINVDGNLKKIDAVIKSFEIAGNVMSGTVNVLLDKKIPNIKAVLNADKLDIASFKKKTMAINEFSLIKSANATTLVGAQLVPYNAITSVNGNVDVNIAKIVNNNNLIAQNIKLQGVVNNGVAELKVLNGLVSDGKLSGVMGLSALNKSLYANINAVNVNLANLMKALDLESNAINFNSGSQTDLHINIIGKGNTYAEIIDGLNGQLVGVIDKSELRVGNINKITGNVFSQLIKALNLAKESDDLNVRCAVVRADLTDGKAVFPNGIVLNSDKFTVVADGNINLKNDKINLSIKPFSGKITDTNIASALSSLVKLTGTIQNPKVGLDSASAIKTIVGVATTGPVYFGAQMLIENDGTPCYTALKNTPYAEKFPKPKGSGNIAVDGVNSAVSGGEDIVKGTSEGVAKVLNDSVGIVRGTTKGIFNILSGGASNKAN